MAASANPSELQYLLECSVCLTRFQDPRVLPCLHTYCLQCLTSHVSSNKNSDGSFNCPECREVCIPPKGGVDKFPTHFLVNALKDVIPASPLQQQMDKTSLSAPLMCEYHSAESASEHGTAVIFCTQCDAHFCHMCSKSHGLFGVTKDHKVTSVDEAKPDLQMKTNSNCELEQNKTINWYCRTCSLPASSDCVSKKHTGHDTDKLSIVETAFKQDMFEVSTLAAKRIEALQKIASDLSEQKIKMEEELDKTSTDIADTAASLRQIIGKREDMLQAKVKEIREDARKQFMEADEELETTIGNTSSLKLCAKTLHEASPEVALCTVLQAPETKNEFMHQQNIPAPSIYWSTETSTLDSSREKLLTVGFLGNVDYKIAVAAEEPHKDSIYLKTAMNTTELDYKGNMPVCGIAPIHNHMVCIAHYGQPYIWVYNNSEQLEEKINIQGIDKLYGLVATDHKQGKLAAVDGTRSKVHFVQLSLDLRRLQTSSTDVPMIAERITMGSQKRLLVNNTNEKRCAILNVDGEVLSSIEVPIPYNQFHLRCVLPTESGFVVCDRDNRSVYFVDINGHVLHTFDDFASPRPAVLTNWGHVLIPDHEAGDVKVFSENGSLLGNIQDNNGRFVNVQHVHIDVEEGIMYIACGQSGRRQLKTCPFNPSDLQLLPMPHNITELTMNVQLMNV